MSLMDAFEKLGFKPCHHMVKVIQTNTFHEWAKIYDGEYRESIGRLAEVGARPGSSQKF